MKTDDIKKECASAINYNKPIEDATLASIVADTKNACQRYDAGSISREEWLDRITELEEKSVFLHIPSALSQLIPFNGAVLPGEYDTYSFFLFPSTAWSAKSDDLKKLRQEFKDFGDSIGKSRLAIWLGDDETIDVRRSKLYCDHFGLDYNDGPYVVTVDRRPDVLSSARSAMVIKLNGISTDRVINVLNVLERELRNEKDIKGRPLLYEEVKQRCLTVANEHSKDLKDVAMAILKLK